MRVEFLGVPTTLGLPRHARRHGPEALRAAGLLRALLQTGAVVNDLGDLALPEGQMADPADRRVAKMVEAAFAQSQFWLEHHQEGALMLTAGGDHSASLGTIQTLQRMGQSFDLIWIDAHGDFNTLKTSPTGNPHGMVLALACGLLPAHLPRLLEPQRLSLWGIRDLDRGEQLLLRQHGVSYHTPEQVRRDFRSWLSRLGPNLYISFDMDSVDPVAAPGTMTPVPGGFTRAEALELVAAVARERRLLALDVVELHPDRDRFGRTVQLALAVAAAAVGAQMHRGLSAGVGAAGH